MTITAQSASRRLGIITIDQAVSGASNLVIVLLAAHALGVGGLGLFTIVFATYAFVQGLSRSLVADPLLVHPRDADRRPRDAIEATTLIGLGFASVVLLVGLVTTHWRSSLGYSLMILAGCLPLLMLQDLGRSLGFATRRPIRSLVLDVSWLALVGVAFAGLFSTGAVSLAWFVFAWAGTGAASGLLVLWQYRVLVLRPNLRWVREKWEFSSRYLLISVFRELGSLVGPVAIGAVSGPFVLGAMRASLVLVRPYMTVQVAAVAAGVAEIARDNPDNARLHAYVRKMTFLMTLGAMINLALLTFLPRSVGKLLLGSTWEAAQPLILAASILTVASALSSGVTVAMFGARAIKRTVRIDVANTILITLCMVGGAIFYGAPGAIWGMAAGQGVGVINWWAAFVRQFPSAGVGAMERPVDTPADWPPSQQR